MSLVVYLAFAIVILPQFFSVSESDTTNQLIPLTSAIISAVWAALLAGDSKPGCLSALLKLPSGIRNYVLAILILVMNLSVIFLIEILIDDYVHNMGWVFVAILAALALFAVIGLKINFNYLSPHFFYRNRLSEAFLETKIVDRAGKVIKVRDDTKLKLSEINPEGVSAPYHLVICAMSLLGTWHLKYKDRKSIHFQFTKDFVGSDITGYVRTKEYRKAKEEGAEAMVDVTSYSRVIALSGAAASSSIGIFSFFAQAFMLTLLNVRLGLWMVNPREYKHGKDTPTNLKIDLEKNTFWPKYLLDELRARISERRELVNIADGGHTRDNATIYPLLRRRCKFIIVGDASLDKDGVRPDLYSALQYAELELGIEGGHQHRRLCTLFRK